MISVKFRNRFLVIFVLHLFIIQTKFQVLMISKLTENKSRLIKTSACRLKLLYYYYINNYQLLSLIKFKFGGCQMLLLFHNKKC